MPRIDPSQLLRTLSVLLAKDGGIRSAEEVPRIVQLMQKFSKKLVSKCIYIHILCSSSQELLESFLSQKGWDLLNMWFSDAIKNQNYYLCGDLVKLFAVCPMNSARLKENVEINQAPKLIRQLSCDTRIEQSVRNLALQVLQQWMSVIRAPSSLPVSGTEVSESNGDSNGKENVSNNGNENSQDKEPLPKKTKASPKKSPKEKKRHNVINSSESEDNVDEDIDVSNVKRSHNNNDPLKPRVNHTVKSLKTNSSRDDSTDVDDLLAGDTTSEDERKKEKDLDIHTVLKRKKEERAKERERKEKEKEREKEERRRREREKERKRAQERKDKAKPYSRTELRTSLDSSDKERIKEVAKKLKEESGVSSSNKISKISKPGSEKEDRKKNGASFGDMLGELDIKKPKPKAPPIKNKNKDLLDSISNPSPSKPKAKIESRVDEKIKRDKERRNSISKSTDDEKISKASESSEKDKESERPKPKIIVEKAGEKRSLKEASPKVETKKSPSIIKESSFFGDVLGDIMKEPPRKKKRRPSDVKSEKEVVKESSDVKDVEGEKSDQSDEKMDTASNSDDLAFAEPTSDLPREVRGILVYVKGSKTKRNVKWKSEDKLVEIEYFELDETERANVWKIKSFEEMKKKEAMFEKMKFQTSIGGVKEDDLEDAPRLWKLLQLEFDPETTEAVSKIWEIFGSQSAEKSVQEQRELRVLKSLFFNQVPCDPSEPDPGSCDKSGEEPKIISTEDLSDNREDSTYDYSTKDWPVPALQSQQNAPPISSSNINDLLKDLNPSLLASLPPPNMSSPQNQSLPPLNPTDVKLFAAQKAAAETLAASSFNDMSVPPPGVGPPPRTHNGFSSYQPNYQDRGGQKGHNYDRGYKGGNSYHHNNHYNKNYKGRDSRDNRDDHRDRGYRERQHDYKRPCKFWMERGRCKDEDRCMYPHPSR